jgi:predicted dehydrogenase
LKLLIVGEGRWGKVYARTLQKMKIPFWQTSHYWHCYVPNGVIVATPPETHYGIARVCLGRKIPVLVEKPITFNSEDAQQLVSMGGIGFAGHTRLYSKAWREFKARHQGRHVQTFAGGTERDPWWDWGPHLVAMSFDLGCETPEITVTKEPQPLRVIAGGETFTDVPDNPLETLIAEFVAAIRLGQPNNEGLQLGARVVDYLERHEPR